MTQKCQTGGRHHVRKQNNNIHDHDIMHNTLVNGRDDKE